MTGQQMLDNLGLRLEDPAQTIFTQAAKLDALNLAQKSVANMVDNNYLAELQTITATKTTTEGQDPGALFAICSYATAFSTALPIRNGIVGVFDEENNLWCTMIEPGDAKRLENSYLDGVAANPVAFAFGHTIYIRPSNVSSIKVLYLKSPADLAASGTECELNLALQEMVLDFAEAQLWRMDAKGDRGNVSYNNALNMVKILNERYQAEKPTGIGTQGR